MQHSFLHRYADRADDGIQNGSLVMGPGGVSFFDVRHGDVANHVPELEWLTMAGVTRGCAVGSGIHQFRGMSTVVRQDMAAFLHRLYGLHGG